MSDDHSRPRHVICATCDHANPPGSKFCNECGLPVHLAECPHCEAINDRSAEVCYKCEQPLGSIVAPAGAAEAEAPPPVPTLERAAAALPESNAPPVPPGPPEPENPASVSTPVHYLGVLTAPADEAELHEVDVAVDRRARRARRIRNVAAALVVMPSIVAATLYGLQHQEQVDQLVDYARVAVLAPLVRGVTSVLDSHRDEESGADKTQAVPEERVPALPGQPGTGPQAAPDSSSAQPAHGTAPSETTQAADSVTGASATSADTAH